VRRADNLTTFHVPIVLKSGNLNLLELSGPAQVCNGNAFIGFMGLLPLACWDSVFESRRQHGYLSLMSVVCCQVEVFASG